MIHVNCPTIDMTSAPYLKQVLTCTSANVYFFIFIYSNLYSEIITTDNYTCTEQVMATDRPFVKPKGYVKRLPVFLTDVAPCQY